jgi:hypothetical protein
MLPSPNRPRPLPRRCARIGRRAARLGVIGAFAVAVAGCAGVGAEPGTGSPSAAPAAPATVASSSGARTPPSAPDDGGSDGAVSASSATRIGQFVAQCPFSHRSSADPLVRPHGQAHDAADGHHAGPPHSHDFFGNSSTDEHSTIASLEASTTTTCDLVEDLSSYWAPTLSRGGVAVQPSAFAAYYDSAPGMDPAAVQPMPAGLSMIAGNDDRPGAVSGVARWGCGKKRSLASDGVPACGLGAPLTLHIDFPDCWNGRDVDSADHRSHVAYSTQGACPPSHPVPIVRLVLSIRYPIYGDPADLTLSSGTLDTAHADFMDAWTEQGMREFVDLCIYRRVICGVA